MIITVTMNPAIDKTVEVDKFQPYALNRIRRIEYDAGGKGINVSKTIHALGGESLAMGFLGGNTGKTIENVLNAWNIRHDFIYVDDLIEAVYRLGFKETNKPFYYIGSGNPKVLKDYLIRIGELVGCADKVGIGVREDDGVKYTMDMFDNSNLVSTIGEYASIDFDKGINKTINWLKNSLML